ncbi:MAG: CPBP family intramembrane metalloprotease [Chloroflexota bacterium]|nr:CPBP family intramembrane metalloprotease [Chloroflexota bacterium]
MERTPNVKVDDGSLRGEDTEMLAPHSQRTSTRSLVAFFTLAFALSWWPWALMLLNPNSLTLIPWGPLVAAFIMVAILAGRRGLKALISSMVRWRVGFRWYAVAILLPVTITLLAAYINVLLGAQAPTAANFNDWYTFPFVLLVTFFLKGPLTEEVAWRGFALPRLIERMSPVAASLLLGVIWALWHLPLLVSDPSVQRPPVQFVVAIVAMSILFTWMYLRTSGCVLLATLMHAMINSLAAFVFPTFQGDGYGRLWWIYAGVLSAAAVVVMVSGLSSCAAEGRPGALTSGNTTTVRMES